MFTFSLMLKLFIVFTISAIVSLISLRRKAFDWNVRNQLIIATMMLQGKTSKEISGAFFNDVKPYKDTLSLITFGLLSLITGLCALILA